MYTRTYSPILKPDTMNLNLVVNPNKTTPFMDTRGDGKMDPVYSFVKELHNGATIQLLSSPYLCLNYAV
jgi:hypothetical protein